MKKDRGTGSRDDAGWGMKCIKIEHNGPPHRGRGCDDSIHPEAWQAKTYSIMRRRFLFVRLYVDDEDVLFEADDPLIGKWLLTP